MPTIDIERSPTTRATAQTSRVPSNEAYVVLDEVVVCAAGLSTYPVPVVPGVGPVLWQCCHVA